MRILLPPSEAKRSGGRGRPLAARTFDPPIGPLRERTIDALLALVDDPAAATALLLPPSTVDDALADDRAVLTSPTMPAMTRYCGVLYDGLDVERLSPVARRLAGRELLIFSGLFGVLLGSEPVPAYRVPGKATLPGVGVASTFWRSVLDGPLQQRLGRSGPIIDLRSTDYAAMWQPAPGSSAAARLIAVRIQSPRPTGGYSVISYASKLAKGRLAAALLERAGSGVTIGNGDDVAEVWLGLGGADATIRRGRIGTAVELFE